MSDPKFGYKSKVRITKGFYRGHSGTVQHCRRYGIFVKGYHYKVELDRGEKQTTPENRPEALPPSGGSMRVYIWENDLEEVK